MRRESTAMDKTNQDHNSGYDITLMTRSGEIKSLWIPVHAEGRYFFVGENEEYHTVYFDAYGDKYYAYCAENLTIALDEGNTVFKSKCVPIADAAVFLVMNKANVIHFVLFVKKTQASNRIYHNYYVKDNASFTIGKNPNNDIVYHHRMVSSCHAEITFKNFMWHVRDNNSRNGTYVNGKNIQSADLQCGDIIFIMGLRIVIGVGFISINDGIGQVEIASKKIIPLSDDIAGRMTTELPKNMPSPKIFTRLPRKYISIKHNTINIESPPMKLDGSNIPLFLRMGSSAVMSGSAAMAGNMLPMVSMMLFPFLNHKYTENEKKEYEKIRQSKYGEYLQDKKEEIREEKEYEEVELNRLYPPLKDVIMYPEEEKSLWERSRQDNDFLTLRLGTGRLPLIADYRYNDRRFSLEEDSLEDRMYEIAEKQIYTDNVPITLQTIDQYIVGIAGEKKHVLEFVKGVILQSSFLYGYDELKIILITDKNDAHQFNMFKYLPHIWNEERTVRFFVTDFASAKVVNTTLTTIFADDLEKPRELNQILKERSYYLVFALSEKSFRRVEILKRVLSSDHNIGVSIFAYFDKVPKESKVLISLNKNHNRVTYLKEADSKDHLFDLEPVDNQLAQSMIHKTANYKLDLKYQTHTFPKVITFLEMLKVGRVEHINSKERWASNNPINSLAVPIGVTSDGDYFTLDLHEKFQGPHGLVAGMTGSGKSEFLLTYILSLAVSFHPDEVSFVLIDYKGGGLAGAFHDPERGIHLPHVVGTITNLDGSAIQRSLMSIESELKRRQKMLNKAKRVANEGTMDIYSYQKLYRNGVVKEPLPHLFLIADEFAELKAQEPEFMDKLISTARIGRSLGVHLILATQKPAGVVNDQIKSNIKFSICLKVQSRADSLEMLDSPAAAEITDTGRFILKVGYNELFKEGQSAWCGAPYEAHDQVFTNRDESVNIIDDVGQTLVQAKPFVQNISTSSEIVSIVKYVQELAARERILPKQLWMDPLPASISIKELMQRNDPNDIIMGMIDDPENQSQFPLKVELNKNQNIFVVGGNRSGKSSILETFLYTLTKKYSPEEINYYIIDYSSHMLSIFSELPYCGGYFGEGDETEVEKIFILLKEIIKERKKLFVQSSVSSYEGYVENNSLPRIFVVIDNYTGLLSWRGGEAISYELGQLIRDSNAVGIYFAITAASVDDVSFRIKKELGLRFVLSAKNKYEFGDVLGIRCDFVPMSISGRGMCRIGDRCLEVQFGRYAEGDTERIRMQKLHEELITEAKKYSGGYRARRLKLLNEEEEYSELLYNVKKGRIPLGYSLPDLNKVLLPLKQFFCLSLYIGNKDANIPVISNFLVAANNEKMQVVVIKREKGSVFSQKKVLDILKESSVGFDCYECNAEDNEAFLSQMIEEINKRKKYRDLYCKEKGAATVDMGDPMEFADYMRQCTIPLLIIFENFSDFCTSADRKCQSLMLQLMENSNGFNFNFHFLGCFEADDAKKISSDSIYQAFNPSQLILLFGGQFDKQGLVPLSMDYIGISAPMEKYNKGILYYRGKEYPIFMPCGKRVKSETDPDLEAIISK